MITTHHFVGPWNFIYFNGVLFYFRKIIISVLLPIIFVWCCLCLFLSWNKMNRKEKENFPSVHKQQRLMEVEFSWNHWKRPLICVLFKANQEGMLVDSWSPYDHPLHNSQSHPTSKHKLRKNNLTHCIKTCWIPQWKAISGLNIMFLKFSTWM